MGHNAKACLGLRVRKDRVLWTPQCGEEGAPVWLQDLPFLQEANRIAVRCTRDLPDPLLTWPLWPHLKNGRQVERGEGVCVVSHGTF